MCNCQQTVIEKFKELYPAAENIDGQYEMLSGRAYSVVKIKIPDKKKPIEKLLLHTFCPVCGNRYEKLGEEKP